MSVWKPKIWRSGGVWICSYYRNSSAGAYSGPTPSGAYDAWKWRDELRQRILGDRPCEINQGVVK